MHLFSLPQKAMGKKKQTKKTKKRQSNMKIKARKKKGLKKLFLGGNIYSIIRETHYHMHHKCHDLSKNQKHLKFFWKHKTIFKEKIPKPEHHRSGCYETAKNHEASYLRPALPRRDYFLAAHGRISHGIFLLATANKCDWTKHIIDLVIALTLCCICN